MEGGGKVGTLGPIKRVVVEAEAGPTQLPGPGLGVHLPPGREYGRDQHAGDKRVGSPNGVLMQIGFGLEAPTEFGALPLEHRIKLTQDVANKRRRRVAADDAARLTGWREDYGKHLSEGRLDFGADGSASFGGQPLVALNGVKGRTTLGVFRREHPDGARVIKLLPQSGFHDMLAGNLLAEQLGGPKIHGFGRLETEGGRDRLKGYDVVMFVEMEELHPDNALGRLKTLLKEMKGGAPPRLPIETLADGIAQLIVAGMIHGIAPGDPDVLFAEGGKARPIDGDFYQYVFDPEEIIGLMRRAFNTHGWDDFKAPVREAMAKAIAAAPIDDRKRRNLADALQVF